MSTAASWIQAVGSIGAIGAALWIATTEIRQRKKEKKEYRKTILEISQLAYNELTNLDQVIQGDPEYLYHEGITSYELNRHISALETVTLETLKNKEAFVALHEFERLCNRMTFIVDNVKGDVTPSGVNPDLSERSAEIKKETDAVMERLTCSLKQD